MTASRKTVSKVKSIWPRLHLRACEARNPLGNLFPGHTRHWWPLVEDIFQSQQMAALTRNIFSTFENDNEFLVISIDCTLKVCMSVKGQAHYRAAAEVRNSACFNDEDSLRRVLTIRGRTSAVLAMVPVRGEDATTIADVLKLKFSTAALHQVRYVSTDSPSLKLFQELHSACPNLIGLCLDPVHLAIVYEYAQCGRRSAGSKMLRAALNRINQIDSVARPESWGPFFCGVSPPSLSREEERTREAILNPKNLGMTRARNIIDAIDSASPMYCRITFIESVAAICKLHQEEVVRKVTGSNKELRKVLWAACAPERLEWLFNGARLRHALTPRDRALLPSGTASNESLHAQINSWTRSIRSLHQSTLRLKLDIMHFGKMLAHHVATCFPTVRQTEECVLLSRTLCASIWSEATWAEFCQGNRKATLPLHSSRKGEALKVKSWVQKRPATKVPKAKPKKRNVLTVARRHSIKSGGRRPKSQRP